MFNYKPISIFLLGLALSMPLLAAGIPLTRAQALQGLSQPAAAKRGEAVIRLAGVGTMQDANKLVARLDDEYPIIRELAEKALWQIWSRSGNAGIDAQYTRGVAQMDALQLDEALATFTGIIRQKPTFAEAWNKRATIYYLQGKLDLSMKDCDEVLKRNHNHFGALSGYAQMFAKQGDPDRAMDYFERALKVHPHMAGAAQSLLLLRQQVQAKRNRMI